MNIALLNCSAAPDDAFVKLVEGLRVYAGLVCDAWEYKAVQLEFLRGAKEAPVGWLPLVAFNVSDEPGDLGYHAVDGLGRPYGRAFLDIVPNKELFHDPKNHGASLAGVLSHELAEMIGDQFANYYADGQYVDETNDKTYGAVALELCDPVQEHAFTLTLEDDTLVDCSNFVYPSWFNAEAQASEPFDHMGFLTAPFKLLPGGYVICRKATEDGCSFAARKIFHEVKPDAWRLHHSQLRYSRGHMRLGGQ